MPFTILVAQRTHFKKLVKYIRLNDYLILNAKLSLAIDSTNKVLKFLLWDPELLAIELKNKKPGQNLPMYPLWKIDTTLNLDTCEIEFNPDIEKIIDTIDKSLILAIQNVCHNDMLVED